MATLSPRVNAAGQSTALRFDQMLFNSYAFIFVFLPVVMAVFFLVGRASHKGAALWLALASLVFYGWWNPRFVILVLVSILVNYTAGYHISRNRRAAPGLAKTMLTLTIVVDLGILAYYKYTNFFIANVSHLAEIEFSALDIILPIGVSFFTFTQIAFLVDAYRGIAREYNFIHYVLFVTYFPHLVAGPVLHHKQMMPQFAERTTYTPSLENINIGLTIFVIGLAKKVLLADQFALYADPIFSIASQGGHPTLIEAWVGGLAYTLQLYFDFSGYSDMAIGLSRMFNIRLPLNFDSPYKAPNIIEFWRRWHMTLSAFLRDYLYIPLGGNRNGPVHRHMNLMITMLLGGLWHGAGWTFVLWGGLHGTYLIVNHLWRSVSGRSGPALGWRAIPSGALTFTCVVFAWVPFRAPDLDTALRLWAGMSGINGLSLPPSLAAKIPAWLHRLVAQDGALPLSALNAKEVFLAVPLGLAIVWLLPNTQQLLASFNPACDCVRSPAARGWRMIPINGAALGILFAASLMMLTRESAFLYFQF